MQYDGMQWDDRGLPAPRSDDSLVSPSIETTTYRRDSRCRPFLSFDSGRKKLLVPGIHLHSCYTKKGRPLPLLGFVEPAGSFTHNAPYRAGL